MTLDQLTARARTSTEADAHKRRVYLTQGILYRLCHGEIDAGRAQRMLTEAGLTDEAARVLVESARKNMRNVR